MAVTTRLEVTFAVSRLARFLIDTGPLYYKTADKVISYLVGIKNLTFYLGDSDNLKVVNNTLFADNTLDRKNFQVFVMKLFGGLICGKLINKTLSQYL